MAAARAEAKQAAEAALTAKLAEFQSKLAQVEQARAEAAAAMERKVAEAKLAAEQALSCLLYTSPSPRDRS